MDGWDLAVMLKMQYPQFLAILDKPGVFDVLQQAFSGTTPWTQDRINAALANTPYYLNTPKQYRDWDINAALDPSTALEKYKGAQLQAMNLMQQTGIHLQGELPFDPFNPQINLFGPPTQYSEFIRNALAMGWNNTEMKYALQATGAGFSGGETQANVARAIGLADDYGVPLSMADAGKWGYQLTGGAVDENGYKGYLIEQAKSLYPGLANALDRGVTVRQYAAPYLSIAQQELGIDPTTTSLTDPKWMAALNQVDPKTGNRVSMSLTDWTSKIRSDPTYGYDQTDQARSKGAQLSTQLAQMMGGLG